MQFSEVKMRIQIKRPKIFTLMELLKRPKEASQTMTSVELAAIYLKKCLDYRKSISIREQKDECLPAKHSQGGLGSAGPPVSHYKPCHLHHESGK